MTEGLELSGRLNDNTRRMLIAVAATVALVALAAPALATWGNGQYLTFNSSGVNNFGSPHGAYTTSTRKCAVCHAVHNAAPGAGASGSEVLLRSTVAEACTYCHVSPGVSTYIVYGGDERNYASENNDWSNAHNWYLENALYTGVQCGDCHQVHAADVAMTANGWLTDKILRGGKTDVGYDGFAKAPLDTDSKNVALSKWCTRCHKSLTGGYYQTPLGVPYDDHNGWTHLMTAFGASYNNPASSVTTQVAWGSSEWCQSCHNSGFGTATWPHYTQGVRFLTTAANSGVATIHATNSRDDGVCLRCHRNGVRGVGCSY